MSIRCQSFTCATLLAAILLFAAAEAAGQDPVSAETSPQPATFYVFNDSGKTLVSGKQKVKDNGRDLITLSRHTYQKIPIAAGPHVFTVPHDRKPRVELLVEAGKTYYLVVAYRPSRSWAGGVAGDPTILVQISADEARGLMQTMKEVNEKPPA